MRFILTPIGSEGDLNPFITLGLFLQSRGHEVVFIHDAYFTEMLAKVPLVKLPAGDPTAFAKSMQDPDLWHPLKAFRVIGEAMSRGIHKHYDAIVSQLRGKDSLIIAPMLAPAARIVGETKGIKVITAQLQPSGLASLHDTPVMANPHAHLLVKMPRFVKRAVYGFGNKVSDGYLAPGINRFREQLGLQPVKNILLDWTNSPDGVLCLFPEWFGPAQPDWPQPLVHASFPDFDHGSLGAMPDDVTKFFTQSRPVIVTAGTANVHAARYFAVAVAALEKSNVPAALLTRHREQLPRHLSEQVRWFDYLPFSLALPLSRGIMHHGGVGTLFQAMRAGVPQFVAPLAHDQFDHGWRVRKLGLGHSMPMSKMRGRHVEAWLKTLAAGEFQAPCAVVAARLVEENFRDRCVAAFSRLGVEV